MNDRFGNRLFRKWRRAVAAGLLAILLPRAGFAQSEPVLFADDFDKETAAAWSVFDGSDDGVPDFSVEFNCNYGTNSYTLKGVTKFIPPAPNSANGTTRGVKLTVNKDDNPAGAAVNLYPKNQN